MDPHPARSTLRFDTSDAEPSGGEDAPAPHPWHYEILSQIATGGMSTVYLARQVGSAGFAKTVALKLTLPKLSHNAEFARLFTGEAKLVADLVHENIVQVYHLGEENGRFFIAMEYVDGVDLAELIDTLASRGLQLDADLCAFIISRVCRALEYAHNKHDRSGEPLSLVHRDVSPRNIMINYEGVVKLTDFGIAKARRVMEQQEGEVLLGKAAYMSPEQARRMGTDRRSDLFSLGAVMYELLTGEPIFYNRSLSTTLENVKSATFPDPRTQRPDLPERLCAILAQALQRERDDRYDSAAEMGDDLERFMYHDRYGPTNVTLGRYVRKLLLGIDAEPGEARGSRRRPLSSASVRGDTMALAEDKPKHGPISSWWKRRG